MKNIFDKKFFLVLATIFSIEVLSYLGFVWPAVNTAVFFLICAAALILSLKDLKLGLLVVLAELFIGSFGYLFSFQTGGLTISIRIALWLIMMGVWLGKVLMGFFPLGSARGQNGRKNYWRNVFTLPYGRYFYALFAFVALGLIVGYFNHNGLANIYFDTQHWFYLALIFPLAQTFKTKDDWQKLLQMFTAAMVWLAVETLLLLYFFSHFTDWNYLGIYRWLRTSGVGEVTNMAYGFVRIFFQSHIYAVFALCLLLPVVSHLMKNRSHPKSLLAKESLKGSGLWLGAWLAAGALSMVLISLSRSFWLGLAAAGLVFVIYLLRHKFAPFRWVKLILWSAGILGLSLLLITLMILFPLPGGKKTFSPWDVFSQRTDLSGEAAAVSRWNLLPLLMQKISAAPLLGSGFGTTITYHSSDPRISGSYTTYAFEWGWLDLWLKLGLLGTLVYLLLLIVLARDAWRLKSDVGAGILAVITSLAVIHFFTPYLNHPLGLGAIMLIAVAIKNYELGIMN
jgi:hypothetical protein